MRSLSRLLPPACILLLLAAPAAATHSPTHPPVEIKHLTVHCDPANIPNNVYECARCDVTNYTPHTLECKLGVTIGCVPNTITPRHLRPSNVIERCRNMLDDGDETTPTPFDPVMPVVRELDPIWDEHFPEQEGLP